MSSLFDIYDSFTRETSQHEESSRGSAAVSTSSLNKPMTGFQRFSDTNSKSVSLTLEQLPTFCIVDETLRNLYGSTRPSKSPTKHSPKSKSPTKSKTNLTSPTKEEVNYAFCNNLEKMKKSSFETQPITRNQASNHSTPWSCTKEIEKTLILPPISSYTSSNIEAVLAPNPISNDLRIEEDETHKSASDTREDVLSDESNLKLPDIHNKGIKKRSPPKRRRVISPDIAARECIKKVTEEIKRWEDEDEHSQSAQQFSIYLSDQFFTGIVLKLHSTPFVELAKKKIALKIEKFIQENISSEKPRVTALDDALRTTSCKLELTTGKLKVEEQMPTLQISSGKPRIQNDDLITPAVQTRRKIASDKYKLAFDKKIIERSSEQKLGDALTTMTQQTILDRLIQLPDEAIRKLPKAQQDLVYHTRRYRQMILLTPDQIKVLPPEQQQMIKSLRNQMGLPT